MLYTIGYEGLDAERFLGELRTHQIRVLIDVRELPLSRKPGFSKSALSELLTAAGVEYRHLRELGAPREVRHRLRHTGDWQEYCIGYWSHLDGQDEALGKLSALIVDTSVCLMCFEADFQECHRSLIADRLVDQGRAKEAVHLSPQKDRAVQPSAVA